MGQMAASDLLYIFCMVVSSGIEARKARLDNWHIKIRIIITVQNYMHNKR